MLDISGDDRGLRLALAEEILSRRIARESLRHPRHSDVLLPLRKRFERLLVKRWNIQRRRFLTEARHWLGKMAAGHFTEADAELKAKLQKAVTAKIEAGTAMSQAPSRNDTDAYNEMVEAAASGAIQNLAVDLKIEAAADAGKTFALGYLKKKGFHQLAADIDATSRDRIANAVADTFAGGGTLNDAIGAIQDAFSAMKEDRAAKIAHTELNDTYNAAMLSSAKETGDELLKTWDLDGDGCPEICEPNAAVGPIPLDEDFPSGDDAPTAHPWCDCSLGFVRASEA